MLSGCRRGRGGWQSRGCWVLLGPGRGRRDDVALGASGGTVPGEGREGWERKGTGGGTGTVGWGRWGGFGAEAMGQEGERDREGQMGMPEGRGERAEE